MDMLQILDLGRFSFREALALQEQMVDEIWQGRREETVLMLEHPPVFTVGRRGKDANLLAKRDFDGRPVVLERINRGGDVTFHGPGQLVVYPLLDLRRRGRNLHRYLRRLEEVVIRVCDGFGVESFRRQGLTGVWTAEGKLASIGVGVRHWVTMHGLALNVATDLRYFSMINPCGIPACPVTSLSRLCRSQVSLGEVGARSREIIREVFGTPATARKSAESPGIQR